MEKEGVYEVDSLSVAAYCLMNGLQLKEVRFRDKERRIGPDKVFVLEDPEGKAPNLSLEYYNSEFAAFDDSLKRVRGFLRASERNRR